MGEASDIRMGLLRRRVGHGEFAERCGMSEVALKEALSGEVVCDEVRNAYASLDVEEEERKALKRRKCVSGKAVRNEYVMMVDFSDGSTGLVRKKKEFSPKSGIPMEVEETDESGVWGLVGEYRDNGVRLDA